VTVRINDGDGDDDPSMTKTLDKNSDSCVSFKSLPAVKIIFQFIIDDMPKIPKFLNIVERLITRSVLTWVLVSLFTFFLSKFSTMSKLTTIRT